MANLYNIIQGGYKTADQQRKMMHGTGYVRDDDLSNHNNQVYYNDQTKDLIYNTSGTHNLKDVITDFSLIRGNLKNTERYKSAHKGLRQAKIKYQVDGATVTGDSLGGGIASLIHSKDKDKAYTFNKATTFLQKSRNQSEKSYRIKYDAVSALNMYNKNTTTLKNDNHKLRSIGGTILTAHMPHNLKKKNIII